MKRLLFWYLPLAFAILAAVALSYGFTLGMRGNVGAAITASARVEPKAATPRDQIRVIVLGDSLARGTGDEGGLGIDGRLAAELKRRDIPHALPVNLAVNGSRTVDVLRQLESANVRTLIAGANAIIISVGGNDLNVYRAVGPQERPQEPTAIMNEVLERLETIVSEIREVNPHGRIFLLGVYNPFVRSPWGSVLSVQVNRWNARLIERFENDPNLTVVQISDLFSHRDRLSIDQFHPGGEGYTLIGRRIADAL